MNSRRLISMKDIARMEERAETSKTRQAQVFAGRKRWATEKNLYVLFHGDTMTCQTEWMTAKEFNDANRQATLNFIKDLDHNSGARMLSWRMIEMGPETEKAYRNRPRMKAIVASAERLKAEFEALVAEEKGGGIDGR